MASLDVVTLYPPMRANLLLKENILALLRVRGNTRKDLSQWCRRTESWISKIFKQPDREIPIKYLDRIADFFGLATYQLFQPGIARATERRTTVDRRRRAERRVSHAQRFAQDLSLSLPPRPEIAADVQHHTIPRADLEPLTRALNELQAQVAILATDADDDRQVASARPRKAKTRKVVD